MTHVSVTFPVDDLMQAISDGWVRVQTNEDNSLSIYNYSELSQYKRYWNTVTLNCRGLILDNDMNIVARPWKKFFNFGERPLEFSTADPTEVTDKKDGSLGILYRNPITGDYAIATRGSFASNQAIHATDVWNNRYSHIVQPLDGYTFLFEIVYPENRIVLDYGELDDLILLGAVQIERGFYYGPSEAAGMLNWSGPVTEVFEYGSLNDCFKVHRPNAEGLVIRSGTSIVKMKQEDYVSLHKLVTGLNERAVWERLKDGESRDSICASLPDEFHKFVDDTASDLEDDFSAIYLLAHQDYCKVMNKMKCGFTRKDFALEAKKYHNPSLLFNFLDNKSNHQSVWDMIRPKGE